MINNNLCRAADILREKKPLVHCITNYVTATDTANILLAAGASPIMADDPAESAEITSSANALLINLGTPSENRIAAMECSCRAATVAGIPVVLDPVGVGASSFRADAVRRILSAGKVAVVRGNISELSALAGTNAHSHGVDAAEDVSLPLDIALTAAKKLGCICVLTGEVDIITDGSRTVCLKNGTAKLKQITGAGCMTSALTAAFASVCDPFSAAVLGAAAMGIFGELAEQSALGVGLGRFHEALFDAAGNMNGQILSERIRYEER